MMSVVDFDELQLLSGYKQAQQGKVCRFLKDNSIPFVVGSDGKPRTTIEMLNEGLRMSKTQLPKYVFRARNAFRTSHGWGVWTVSRSGARTYASRTTPSPCQSCGLSTSS